MMDSNPLLPRLGVVFLGAGLGGVLRYWLGGVVQSWWNAHAGTWSALPLGTLLVNVSGCLAIGVLYALFSGPLPVREEVKLAVLVGVLGGYTTFSAFGRETLGLLQEREFMLAGANVLISNAAGLLAVWGGDALVRRLGGTGVA